LYHLLLLFKLLVDLNDKVFLIKNEVLESMQKKRIILFVLSGVLLLTVIAVGLIALLRQPSTAHGSDPAPTKGSHLNDQDHQTQAFKYPDPTKQDGLPDSVKVTGYGETVLLRTSVTEGYQIYECQASTTDPSGFAWKLQAPSATLKADNDTNVIHSTGPTWLYTKDGSLIKGKVGQFANPDGTAVPASVTPDVNSIPWLRLDVTDHQGNSGLFSNVDQIQRLYTAGGKAPSDGCNQDAANNHVIQSVHYTAEYVFWGYQQ
jgi:hypothetical protein